MMSCIVLKVLIFEEIFIWEGFDYKHHRQEKSKKSWKFHVVESQEQE